MGLGPPCCRKCRVVMRLDDFAKPPWNCPVCHHILTNTDSSTVYPNFYELSKEEQIEFDDRSAQASVLTRIG